ncbi:hypothetical protein [Leadbettera azotonutricia]|uniref:Uncharacterized protein n=1 Tax=Leadbettera azotonutricia (strain ATCC BAA-888 / DSM 13862 / ZAS-9) TaxID=545695 RepID=F5Y9N4_LEAAZ|nr:hypothetical protein [Leadbettera azotonutricia]AEF82019.1 hypothetical protein TREAZ_0797 [Leadbettera azotonutricia ZAS-9]
MNALEKLCHELETLLSDICFSGLKNVHPEILEKLTLFEGTAKELGMERGAALINQFAASLRNYRAGTSNAVDPGEKSEQALKLLCALDFYNKNILGNML